jgi:geranylgeranyl diphosphate synthase type I
MSISTRRSTLDAATEPSRPAEHAPVRLEPRHIGEKKPPERVDATESSVMEEVEALMLQLAAGDRFERLGAIVQEHLLSGGRKLRARMALAALEAFDVELDRGLAWAGACELLHNASLIHDDLQDRDEVRRGKYCVWVRHGEAQAINAGDLLLMLPFVAVEHVPTDNGTRWELSRALARRAEETVRGQSLEMTLFTSCRWDWASYDDAARGKTSALMSLPVQGAALLAGRDAETAWELSECFRDLGLLFQMQDDVVDLFGEKGGRKRGSDVRDGKVTALVVEHLSQHPQDLVWLGPLLGKPRDQTTDDDVEHVARRFFEGGALRGVMDRIRTTADSIRSSPILRREPRLLAVAERLIELSVAPLAGIHEGPRLS